MYNPNYKATLVLADAMDELDLTYLAKHIHNRIKYLKERKAEIREMGINGREHDLIVAGNLVQAIREFRHRAGTECSLKEAHDKIRAYERVLIAQVG